MAARRTFHRTDRLGRQIQQVLAVALQQETHDEALRRVMVTAVEVTRDLSLARVWWYMMEGDVEEAEVALARANGFLRRRVGQEVRMRRTPELRFQHDASIDKGRRIEEILHGLQLSDASDDADADAGADATNTDDPADDPAEQADDA